MGIRDRLAGSIATVAFGGVIAAVPIVLGTSDLDSYEHAFFSLNRGTALRAIQVLGHPVYTLAIGLGVRLPLLSNLDASPAAIAAPYMPAPVTYWLLMTCAIALASFVVRCALEPQCGQLLSSMALLLLFVSAPMVNYTLTDDWLHAAVTYPAFVGCVFAPHALLALLETDDVSWRRYRRGVWVAAAVGGLIGGSHPGYWPLMAGTLVLTSALSLCRSDRPLRDRFATVAMLAAVAVIAVALQIPDLARELDVASAASAGMSRGGAGPEGDLVSTNIFPFGAIGARWPFTHLILAVVSLTIGLTGAAGHRRRLMIGGALVAILLAIGAARWPVPDAVYAPSSTWALRDPALAFAVFAGALVSAEVLRGPAGLGRRLAVAALALAAFQGPAYAVSLIHQSSPEWTPDYRAWNRDLTPPDRRASMLGLEPNRVPPGHRLALWPGESARMRFEKHPTVDFADAGYLLVTAWTRQRTMRQLATPNDTLFYQSIELTPDILCDADAVRFLQLRYLLVEPGVECEPWRALPDLRVDGRLEVRVAAASDSRVMALPAARLAEPLARAPALSPDSTVIGSLTPLAGTFVTLGPETVAIELDDPTAATAQALVLPVAYDSAWRPSNGRAVAVAGLLGVAGVSQPRVTIEFVPDAVASLRAISATLAQLLAAVGLLGLVCVRPLPVRDAALAALEQRTLMRARLEFQRLHPHTRLYLLYAAAVALSLRWTPRDADDTSLATALLVPLTGLAVARLSRSRWWHRGIGASLLALVFFRTTAVGSVSPDAWRDPPFWTLMTIAAIALVAVNRRRPAVASSAAAIAGACAMTATLVAMWPGLPAVREGFLTVTWGSLATLSNQIGVVTLIALFAVWLHAIVAGGRRGASDGTVAAMARGALLVALLFTLGGAVPTHDGIGAWWALVLGALLGLAPGTPLRRSPGAEKASARSFGEAAG